MPAPYYTDERLTLYHGDALAVLAELPEASVDALITDPPYSTGGSCAPTVPPRRTRNT